MSNINAFSENTTENNKNFKRSTDDQEEAEVSTFTDCIAASINWQHIVTRI